ncbi:hypothetical protein [Aquamicrobium zhengzhouense]|uniref:Flagellar assembly protein FliH n=1 Tax=Aquamicrobium zhengzhouense TaxID=2781738 RepID=A0ABS0S8Y7_9HYPH|nr:hypothetical protein [Aquamicrobium zhengzhouense]MBI1619737.1 hypothetical protein [Aquamicrobium zhengzhouense]
MGAPALAAALKDFGAPQHAAPESFSMPTSLPEPAGFPFTGAELPDLPTAMDMPQTPEVDVDALVAEAVAKAEAELSERLGKEHQDALQLERDRHAEELEVLERRHADETAVLVHTAIADMEERVIALTSAVCARILGTVLTDDVRDRSLQRLAALITEALHDEEGVRIKVSGNRPLFQALKDKLPDYDAQIDFTEGPGLDLSVTIDDSMVETRLAEWSAALAEALE